MSEIARNAAGATDHGVRSAYRLGRFEVQPRERRLLIDGQPAPIGARALDVLVVLAEHGGRLVTKDALLARVWSGLVVEENNLHVQVSALRRILGESAIETVPGHGYRLTGDIETPVGQRALELPRPLTRFVGREDDLSACATLLEDARLLTLSGIGGCGKTRLAIALAEQRMDSHPDDVWFVDLASVAEPERVALAVAGTIGVHENTRGPIEDTLIAHLAARRALLVLDNCEHVRHACAVLADRLLGATTSTRILVTSREPLGIAGERIVPVRPLAYPDEAVRSPTRLAAFEAVQLFVERTRDLVSGFTLDDGNAAAIAEICRRLDGIPLAVELAAARMKLLSPEQIRARLDDRFRLLTGGPRTVSRQRTLATVLEWSYEHLPTAERRWLRCLSVFSGGFALDAAAEVAGAADEAEALAHLERLVDASLVVVDRADPHEHRYGMLETVRAYAHARLVEKGEVDGVRPRHVAHFAALAASAHPNLFTKAAYLWYRRLDRELPNLLAAHASCREVPNGERIGLELAANLRLYWINRGRFALGMRVYEEALARGANRRTVAYAQALFALGQHCAFGGRFAESIAPLEEALGIAREHDDAQYVGHCLSQLAFSLASLDEFERARSCADEALLVRVRAGDRSRISSELATRAAIFRMQGDLASAAATLEEALLVAREENVDHMLTIRIDIARVAVLRGDLERAAHALAESVRLLADTTSGYRTAMAIDVASLLAAARGDWTRAARLQGAFDTIVREMGGLRNPYDDQAAATLRRKPRDALGDATYDAIYETGRGLSLEAALADALHWVQPPVAGSEAAQER